MTSLTRVRAALAATALATAIVPSSAAQQPERKPPEKAQARKQPEEKRPDCPCTAADFPAVAWQGPFVTVSTQGNLTLLTIRAKPKFNVICANDPTKGKCVATMTAVQAPAPNFGNPAPLQTGIHPASFACENAKCDAQARRGDADFSYWALFPGNRIKNSPNPIDALVSFNLKLVCVPGPPAPGAPAPATRTIKVKLKNSELDEPESDYDGDGKKNRDETSDAKKWDPAG